MVRALAELLLFLEKLRGEDWLFGTRVMCNCEEGLVG